MRFTMIRDEAIVKKLDTNIGALIISGQIVCMVVSADKRNTSNSFDYFIVHLTGNSTGVVFGCCHKYDNGRYNVTIEGDIPYRRIV